MKRFSVLLLAVLLVTGLAILFYPSISSWYNQQYQIRSVVDYDHSVESLAEEVVAAELAKASAYNEALAGLPLADPFTLGSESALPENYTAILDSGNGVMGSIQIPRIGVNLPIYHGTGTQALEKGVGHMEMTPFPIGGEGHHTVLTGHTGLPNASLFTDLDQLEAGDIFTLQVYRQTLAYQVDQITVVLPTDTAPLLPEDGRDYVSLVTCTPYGVNSHRLLVRGVRIPFAQAEQALEQAATAAATGDAVRYDLVVALAVLVIVIVAVLVLMVCKLAGRRRRGT